MLARGFDYAVVGVIILYMGMSAAMPLRTRYLAIASVFAVISTWAGHVNAANAQKGWLFINILAILNAIAFGMSASALRGGSSLPTRRSILQTRARFPR